MCGRMNIHDHVGIQALLDKLGLILANERFSGRYNVAPGAEIFAAFGQDDHDLAAMGYGTGYRSSLGKTRKIQKPTYQCPGRDCVGKAVVQIID